MNKQDIYFAISEIRKRLEEIDKILAQLNVATIDDDTIVDTYEK